MIDAVISIVYFVFRYKISKVTYREVIEQVISVVLSVFGQLPFFPVSQFSFGDLYVAMYLVDILER